MAWNNRRYYTRSIRVGKRVVREYLGCSAEAHRIAAEDDFRRQRRKCKAMIRKATAEELAEIESMIEQFESYVRGTTAIARIDAGYHNHRGQWRKRRARPHDRKSGC